MKDTKIAQYKDGLKSLDFKIAEEAILHVEINDISFDAIITPLEIKEFVYGNLLSEGFIKKVGDIKVYSEKKKGDIISVRLGLDKFEKAFLRRNYNIIWTECGSAPEIQKRVGEVLKKLKPDFTLDAKEIIGIQPKIKESMDQLEIKGGVHFAALLDDNLKIKHFTYDIGRHNAVDKVIGMNLLRGEKFGHRVLFTTGRISSDIVVKCLRVEIPVIVSSNGPLFSAISLARKYNLCLIGYLRGTQFKIFSGEERIEA